MATFGASWKVNCSSMLFTFFKISNMYNWETNIMWLSYRGSCRDGTKLKRQVTQSHVLRMTDEFACMCALRCIYYAVEPCSVYVRFWPWSVSHLPEVMVISDTNMNGCTMSWEATFFFVIPAVCSEEMNGGRLRRIRETVEQGKAQPGMHCIFPLTELIKGTRDWLGSA